MPIGVAARIEQLMRSFLWEGTESGIGSHLVKWDWVTRDKEDGRLGFGAVRARNEALRAKWLWRFPLEPGSLWHRVIRSKYGIDSNGWDTKVPANGTSRNPWRDISRGYPRFLQCCRFAVGNGERIRFWEDNWLKEGVLKRLFPRLYALSSKKNGLVSCFVNNQQLPGSWDFGFRRNLTESELGEVVYLLEIVGRVSLCSSRLDKRIWEIEEHGNFTCKSFRSYISSNGERERFPPFKSIWKVNSPPKVRFFVWLAAIGRVNTCDFRQRRNPFSCLSPSWCILCKDNEESSDHLFLQCSFSFVIWSKLLRILGSNWVTPKGCFQLLTINMEASGRRKKAQVLKDCLVHATFWNIWLERNCRIFQGHRGASAEEVWERVKFWASLWASTSG